MLILPAIDIKNGKCVRLFQGDFNKEIIFDVDPISVAKKFKKQGAKWLHIIDLDGAKNGNLTNYKIIKQIKKTTKLKIELGGGIRDTKIINHLIKEKIDKIILGTAAILKPEMVKNLNKHALAISIDAKKDLVMMEGWQKKSKYHVTELFKKFIALGIINFIYTDIEKDGTLISPNFKKIAKLKRLFPKINLTIAGGVSSVNDLNNLAKINVQSAIIGKALYTNLDLNKYVSQKNYTVSGR